MTKTDILCPKATTYYVPGIGGKTTTPFKAILHQLVESIFGLDFEPNLQVLPNKSVLMQSVDQELNQFIKKTAGDIDACELISTVWFCHSHGAKMVCDAYKELQKSQPQVFDKIKESSAIICIGGASLATDDMAEVTLNVEFENDQYSKSGSVTVGKRVGHLLVIGPYKDGMCGCCTGKSRREVEYKPASKGVAEVACGLSVSARELVRSFPSTSVHTEYSHLIDEYVQCKSWKKEVRKLLPVAIDTECQVHS